MAVAPAPAKAPPARPRALRQQQMDGIVAALQAIAREDAGDLGLSRVTWGEHRGGQRWHGGAHWEGAVAWRLDRIPRHLREQVRPAMKLLPLTLRQAVELVTIREHSLVAVARALHVCPATISRRRDHGLELLAGMLYTNHGEPRMPPGLAECST
jgi:hypothetical protein